MRKSFHLLNTVFFTALLLSSQTAFAGGSSMSIDLKMPDHIYGTPGQDIKNAFTVVMNTYFQYADIKHIRIDDITVSCYGGNIMSDASILQGNLLYGSAPFNKEGSYYSAHLIPEKLILNNNSTYELTINMGVKSAASMAQDAQCGIQNVTLSDADKHEEIYSGGETGGYLVFDNYKTTTVTFGGAKLQARPFVSFYESDYGKQFVGSGYVRAKIFKDATGTTIKVFGFDENFSPIVRTLFGSTRPVLFSLNISDSDLQKLPTSGLIKLHVRDLYFIDYAGGDQAKGVFNYIQ